MAEDVKSALKLSYAWIIIMLVINTLYVGYVVSDQHFASEDELYNLFIGQESTMNVNINNLNTDVGTYSNKSVSKQGGDDAIAILSLIEGALDIVGWVGFIGVMLTIGGFWTSMQLWSMIENDFLRLLIQLFMIIKQ